MTNTFASPVTTVTITVERDDLAEDLTGNGFVDFEDLTVLLAAWNQNVSAVEGNLVDAGGTPVNFEDLTVLLAAWTGPGGAGAPGGRRLAAAREGVGGDSVGDPGNVGPLVAVGDAAYRGQVVAPRQAAAYGLPYQPQDRRPKTAGPKDRNPLAGLRPVYEAARVSDRTSTCYVGAARR